MGVRFPSVTSNTLANALPASAAETVVLITPPINEPIDNAQVILQWFLSLTAGTSTTGFNVRIRRGTTVAAPVVFNGPWQFTTVAGNFATFGGCLADSPGIVAGQQYCLTLIQTAATGAGTFTDGTLIAMVL